MQSTYGAHTFGDSNDPYNYSNDCYDCCDYSKDYSNDISTAQCFSITCKDDNTRKGVQFTCNDLLAIIKFTCTLNNETSSGLTVIFFSITISIVKQ